MGTGRRSPSKKNHIDTLKLTRHHFNKRKGSVSHVKRRKKSMFNSCLKRNSIEGELLKQQCEISELTNMVEDIRGSLHISDAQNLALQVMLQRLSSTDSTQKVPRKTKSDFKHTVTKSEKQL